MQWSYFNDAWGIRLDLNAVPQPGDGDVIGRGHHVTNSIRHHNIEGFERNGAKAPIQLCQDNRNRIKLISIHRAMFLAEACSGSAIGPTRNHPESRAPYTRWRQDAVRCSASTALRLIFSKPG
jgi:hypothetical protein